MKHVHFHKSIIKYEQRESCVLCVCVDPFWSCKAIHGIDEMDGSIWKLPDLSIWIAKLNTNE